MDKIIELTEILDNILNEYSGKNYLSDIYEDTLKIKKNFDKEKMKIYDWMKDNKFEGTSAYRQFEYVDEFFNKLIKYLKLAKKSIDYVTVK